MKDESVPTFWHNFRSSTSLASEIYTFVFSEARHVGDLKIVSECWERIHLSCIVKDFSCIQREPSQKWRIEYNIMKKHTKYIVVTGYKRVYLSLRCILCVFHDIVLDSSFLTGFTLYTRKILHYTRKMNPFPTFWHNFQISNMPSFWDIHVCNLSLWCILCVFSWYCARFVIFDWVPVVYKSQKWRIEHNIMKKHTKYVVVTVYKRIYLRS